MKNNTLIIMGFAAALLFSPAGLFGAVTLSATAGSGSAYSVISSAGFGNENPDCVHGSFGAHVTQAFDSELGKNVFVFHSHIVDDNDRCTNLDRVRMEIKGGSGSPSELQHTEGQTAWYRWKFRLDSDFIGSSSFTHIFQIKAYGGSDSGAPIITITPRSTYIEVIHSGGDTGTGLGQLASASLAPFLGTWVEAYVRYVSSESGDFEISLKRVSDGQALLSYSGTGLDLWRDASYNRPKWGVYRKKDGAKQDEQVRFADFCVSESSASLCPSDVGDYEPPVGKLEAHLSFDDGTTNDSSGNGNHGVLMNGAVIVDNPARGKVLFLDGVDDYVDLGTDASLDFSDEGKATILAWIKLAATLTDHNSIVTKGEWQDAYSLVIKHDSGDLLWTGNNTSVFSADPILANVWTHVAVVIDGNLTTFYINGQVSGAVDQNRGGFIDNNPLDHTEIGREDRSDNGASARWYFNGRMDDVCLFSTALCQKEIVKIMNNSPDGDVDGDGIVTLTDFGHLSDQWGTDGSADPSADIVPACGDGMVDIQDLLTMTLNFLESD